MRINKIYVICLDPEKEGFQQMVEDKLAACSFYESTPYELIPAFDGRDGDIAEGYNVYDKWDVGADSPHSWNDWWTRPVLPGEIGCAISHRQVWEIMVLEGMGPALILEEDFFNPGNSLSALPDPPVDSNWDIALLGRDIIEPGVEEEAINDTWVRPRHFYNMHAYVIKNTNVAKYLLSGGLKENVIPVDEYVSALGYPHRRDDIKELFPTSLKLVACDPFTIIQNRGGKLGGSTIEEGQVAETTFEEELQARTDAQVPEHQGGVQSQTEYVRPQYETTDYYEILDTTDWEARR